MEKFEILNAERCYICNDSTGSLKNDLQSSTKYSGKPVYQLIEQFANCILHDDIVNEANICQNCFIKFNDFDEHLTIADNIAVDLLELMENKLIEFDEEPETEVKGEVLSSVEELEFDPYGNEIFGADQNITEDIVEEEPEDREFQYEVVVHDVKPKPPKLPMQPKVKKEEPHNIIVIETDNQKLYQCDICSKCFKDKSKLKTHREIHTDERNVICPDCGKGFKTANCLRNHKRLHVPDRIYYNCDRCEKKYTQKVQLKKHIQIVHMLRRDFGCQICGASFGTNSVLKMHLLSHQDFRAEQCTQCGYRFHTKAKLRRHMKSHTGQRDYECDICNKRFLYSYNVIAHKRNVHEKRFTLKDEKHDDSTVSHIVEEIDEENLYEYEETIDDE